MCAPSTRKTINYTINNQNRVRGRRARAPEGSPGRGGAPRGAGRARTGRGAQAPGPAAAMSLKPRVSSVAEVVAVSPGSDHSLAVSSCRPWAPPA